MGIGITKKSSEKNLRELIDILEKEDVIKNSDNKKKLKELKDKTQK